MASTYSDRLRIELISAGDQSGTWGDTTNANLGTLIEEAIAGVSAITMSDANKTLTSNNGVTDEARKMIIKLSGTLTSTRDVIVPTKEKLFIVHNAATGGKVRVKTASGTGVEVSPGFKAVVYCDGTNVVSVLPQALNESTTTNNVLSYNGTTWVASTAASVFNPFSAGMILNWAGDLASPPSGWLTCDGTSKSTSTYSTLHTAIGYAFGGSGSNFNVPDMRDKFVIGAGSTYNVAATGGSADAVIPTHTHTASSASNGSHTHGIGRGNGAGAPFYITYGDGNNNLQATTPTNSGGSHSHTVTVNSTGVSPTGANLPPYVGLGFIIKT